MKKVITAIDISAAKKAGETQFAVPAGALVTPQATDDARSYGISLVRESSSVFAAPRPASAGPALAPARAVGSLAPDPGAVAAVRRQVLARVGAAADPARVDEAIRLVFGAGPVAAADTPYLRHAGGVTQVRHAVLPAVVPGAQAVPGGVQMVEALAPAEGSPGISYMSWERSSFAWTFPQDEVLVVLEGELRLVCEGGEVTALAGDALRIAAGSAVTLAAKGRVRCVLSSWSVS